MSSLASCIKKAGKALGRDDAAAIREIYNDLVAEKVENPAQEAVDEYLDLLDTEREQIEQQIIDQDGSVPNGNIRYAKGTPTLDVARAISSTPLLKGKEKLDIKGKPTTLSLAQALVARTKKANKGRTLDARSNRNKEILAEALAIETAAAMEVSGHAGNWYSEVLENAVNIAAEMHPELKTDINARSAFLLGLAVTSNGMDVSANALYAEEVYAAFKKKGKFAVKGYGDKGPAMESAFELANQLIDRWGLADTVRFLNTEFTVGELNELGFSVSGESVDHVTHGSVIFGPKIGGGFYQNLMGNFDPLTMDRWWMRTWGRLTGGLLPPANQMPEGQKEKLLAAAEADEKMMSELGFTYEEVAASDAKLKKLAAAAHRRYARSGFKEKTALNKAGKNLDLALNAPIIAPRTGTERAWMREVAGLALQKLEQRGMNINAASMQALVWYPEKELYLQNGVGNAKSSPTDYEQEFAKLAAKRGVDQSRIEAARTRDTDGRLAGYMGGAGDVAVETAAPTRLSPQERTRLLQKSATQRIREQLPRTTRRTVPKGVDRELNGAPVAHVFKPERKMLNAYDRVGLAAPEVVELHTGPESAAVFHAAIQKAKNANSSGAAVYAYPLEEYENMRLFLTKDGAAGFALKGDDIVSLFKEPSAKMPGVAQSMIALAVSEGGRKLDAFDTVLPMIYSLQGFKVVSRVNWDDSQAPDGWKKKDFEAFNNGEPDVVFMVYDQSHFDAYTGQNEGTLAEYDQAVEIQSNAVLDLEARNTPTQDLRLRIEDDVETTINRDPESPLSRIHKLGATMEDQANHNPGTIKNIVAAAAEFKDSKGIAGLLAAIPRRNIADFLPESAAPALNAYIRLANRLTGRRNELLAGSEEVTGRWKRHIRKDKRQAGKLSELMHASTLAGVDPSKTYVPLKKPSRMTAEDKKTDAVRRQQYIILKKHYDTALNDEGRELFNQVRDGYQEQRGHVERALEKRIEDSEGDGKSKRAMIDMLRKKFEAGRTAGPYFPLARFGDLWASVKDAEGNVVAYSRFETRAEQRAWMKEWSTIPNVTFDKGRKMDDNAVLNRVDPGFVSRVQELVKDPALQDEIWQMYMRTLPEMSMRKQFMHRKGRIGFSADAIRAYGNTMFHGAHQLAKLEYMYQMENELKNLHDQVRVIEQDESLAKEFNWAAPIYNEMKKRHELSVNGTASPWAVKTTAFGFVWFLGATPAAAMVNLSQTAIVGFPVLAARFNAAGAFKELSRAAAQYAGARGNFENKLRGAEREAYMEAKRVGIFEETQAHDLAGLAEGGEAALGGKMEAGMKIASFMFHKAEQFNREATFMAAYRLAISAGRTQEDAIMEAEDLTWDSHFDYSNENRPRFMQQDLWRVLTLFKQYSLNMTYRLARDFNDSIRGESPAVRKEARQRFAGIMMMTGLMAGYTGLPTLLTAPIKFALEAVFGDDDETFDAEVAMRVHLTEMLGSKAAEAIMKGPVDAFLGMTLSQRVSLGQLWLRDPGVNDKGDDLFLHYFMEAAGPIPSTIKDVGFAGPQLIAEGHTQKGIEKMLPKFARDALRALRYSTEGATTLHTPSDVLLEAEKFSPVDIFYQTFGFVPAKLTMQYEQNEALRTAEAKILNLRTKAMDRYQLAVFAKDATGIKEAMIKIGEFNKKYPMISITKSALNQGSMNRLERNAQSIGGIRLNKNLNYLYKDMMFTETPDKLKKPEEAE